MINTNLPKIERELLEVLNIFTNANDLEVKHTFKQAENKVVNTITINGKIYAYGNLVSFDNDVLKERLIKRFSKLSLYKALSSFTGESFPWGSLTGIRPTKLAYELKKEDNFSQYMNEPVESEEVTYTKTEINRMSTADLKALAKSKDVEDAEKMSGAELKKVLIEKFGL
jgi:hypothetical protein